MFSLKEYFNALPPKGREKFALQAGIPLPTLQRHYIYKTRIPRPNRMRSLANAAGVPVREMAEFFLQRENEDEQESP